MAVDESAECQSWRENGIKTGGGGGGGKINLETLPGQSREFNVETLIYVSS